MHEKRCVISKQSGTLLDTLFCGIWSGAEVKKKKFFRSAEHEICPVIINKSLA